MWTVSGLFYLRHRITLYMLAGRNRCQRKHWRKDDRLEEHDQALRTHDLDGSDPEREQAGPAPQHVPRPAGCDVSLPAGHQRQPLPRLKKNKKVSK